MYCDFRPAQDLLLDLVVSTGDTMLVPPTQLVEHQALRYHFTVLHFAEK